MRENLRNSYSSQSRAEPLSQRSLRLRFIFHFEKFVASRCSADAVVVPRAPAVRRCSGPIHGDQTKTTSNAMQNEIKSKNSNKLTSSQWWLVRPSRASRSRVVSFVVWRLLNEKKHTKKTKYRLKISTLISVSRTYWCLRLASLVIFQLVCSHSCLAIGSRAWNLNFSLRFS